MSEEEKTPKKKVTRKAKAKKFNWRDHLDPKQVILKEEYTEQLEKKYKEPFGELQKLVWEGKDKIDDKYKLILLEGYRGIARARGYVSELLDSNCSTPDYCSFTSTVTWASNEYGEGVTSSDVGECFANQENFPFCYFPSCLSGNRAFVRNIRKFLGIPILGKDELITNKADKKEEESGAITTVAKEPHQILKLKCEKLGYSFDQIKKSALQKEMAGAENWEDWKDIKEAQCFSILGKLSTKE